MTEKYKIYIPEDMKNRLMNDAELFEFFKKDGSINLNSFLKELLINYFDEYRKRTNALLNNILSDLNNLPSITKEDADLIAGKIINTYLKSEKYQSGKTSSITLTVSGDSLDVMRTIENNLLTDVSLSQYINDLFSSYLSIARNDRERIIFKETFQELEKAIQKRLIITFTSTSARDLVFSIKPYFIAASKEEQCNYLLCTDTHKGLLRTFRVSRIKALYITSEKYPVDEEIADRLKEIALKNPQSASKNIDAAVSLTEQGVQKFQVIVKNRPDVLRKEGNIYYFSWPKSQLIEYFKRFGYDAVILYPDDCKSAMKSFYRKSLDSYNAK